MLRRILLTATLVLSACSNVEDVPLPFTSSEYRVGRIRLGEVIQEFTMEDMHKLVIDFPNIVELKTLNDK